MIFPEEPRNWKTIFHVTMNHVFEECLKFGENISVRGVPRAIKSKMMPLRIMWICAVIVSSLILAWQLCTLFIKFYSYPHKTFYEDSKYPNVFPVINICNLHPKVSGINYYEFLTDDEFRGKIDLLMSDIRESKFRSLDPDFEDYKDLMDNMVDLYFNSLPKYTSGNQTIPLLTSYKMWDTSGEVIRSTNCYFGKSLFWDVTYYNCYSFRVNSSCPEIINKLTMIVYTNSLFDVQDEFKEDFMNVEANGVKIILSHPNVIDDISSGFNLGSGTDNVVNMDMIVKARLGKPYNPAGCHERMLLDKSDVDRYSYMSCIGACVQEAVLSRCHCVSSDCYLPRYMQHHKVCGNTSLAYRWRRSNQSYETTLLLRAASEMICKDQTTNQKLYDLCADKCQQPCNETYYDVTIHSMGDWPHVSYYMDFFVKFVEPYLNQSEEMANYFKPFRMAIDEFRQKKITLNDLTDIFGRSSLLKSNFLQVSFQFRQLNPVVICDYPDYTWESMLSFIGGSFSLWLGITMMTAVEVLEFCINVVMIVKNTMFRVKTNNAELKLPI